MAGPRGLAGEGPHGLPRAGPVWGLVLSRADAAPGLRALGWTVSLPDASRWSVRSGTHTDSASQLRPEVVMLGGAGHGVFQFPPRHPDSRGSGDFAGGDIVAERRSSVPWLGRQLPLTASGARTQEAEQRSGEGWLFTSGSEHRPTPRLTQRWPQAGSKEKLFSLAVCLESAKVPWLGLLRTWSCQQSCWASRERVSGPLRLKEPLVSLQAHSLLVSSD